MHLRSILVMFAAFLLLTDVSLGAVPNDSCIEEEDTCSKSSGEKCCDDMTCNCNNNGGSCKCVMPCRKQNEICGGASGDCCEGLECRDAAKMGEPSLCMPPLPTAMTTTTTTPAPATTLGLPCDPMRSDCSQGLICRCRNGKSCTCMPGIPTRAPSCRAKKMPCNGDSYQSNCCTDLKCSCATDRSAQAGFSCKCIPPLTPLL